MQPTKFKCVSKEEFIRFSENNLIASFNGYLRALGYNSTLIITPDYIQNKCETYFNLNVLDASKDAYGRANILSFNLGPEHVTAAFYNTSSKLEYHMISRLDMFQDSYRYYTPNAQTISFYLNNNQTKAVAGALSHMQYLSNEGKYKYISILHDCESVASDTFYYANFSTKYSDFLTQQELWNSNFVDSVLLKNQYHVDAESIVITEREFLNNIFANLLGQDFRKKLHNVEIFKNLTLQLNDENQTVVYNVHDIEDANQNELLKLKPYIDRSLESIKDLFNQAVNIWDEVLHLNKSSYYDKINEISLSIKHLYYMPIVCKILDEIYLNSSFSALYKKLIFILPEELVGEYKLKTDFYNDPNNAEISEIILRKLITSSNNITDAVYRICHQVPENEYCKNLLGTDGAHLLYKVAEFDIFG